MVTERNRESMKPVSHRRVLVPLDGSEMAECVLPHVIELIRPGETQVYLCSILTTGLGDRTVALMTTYPPGMQLSTTALARAQAQMEVYLRDIAARLRERGATVRHAIRAGNPAEEILNHALDIEADMIVMSAHGHSGASRWVYGSVASRVLRGASCPVLLVRPS
jgi:nucleotide-binding universal stress UspA family protein